MWEATGNRGREQIVVGGSGYPLDKAPQGVEASATQKGETAET
jgi:hypothetical protein